MLIFFGWMQIFVGLLALTLILIVLWNRNKSLLNLLFFSVFWIYLMGVVSVVAFPFPTPGSYALADFKPSINLVLLRFGDCEFEVLCIRNIYENILLTVPFGFGISFIVQIKPRNIYWLALAVGLTFETIQLVISLIVHSPFRVIDINDVLLNAVGLLIGYGIFRMLGRLYSSITEKFEIQHKYGFAYLDDVFRGTN